MTEDTIYKNYSGKWLKKANEYFVAKEFATDFLDHLLNNKIRILGIDGFTITPDYTQPTMEVMADYSKEKPERVQTINFFRAEMDKITHFNFVLDFK